MKFKPSASVSHGPSARARALPLALLLPLVLAACGGGSGDGLPDVPAPAPGVNAPPEIPLVAGTDVPQSATTSADGAIAFIRSVVAQTSDTASGLRLGNAVLGTSDTQGPQAL